MTKEQQPQLLKGNYFFLEKVPVNSMYVYTYVCMFVCNINNLCRYTCLISLNQLTDLRLTFFKVPAICHKKMIKYIIGNTYIYICYLHTHIINKYLFNYISINAHIYIQIIRHVLLTLLLLLLLQHIYNMYCSSAINGQQR